MPKQKQKVILDTNILIYCAKYKVDLFRELAGFEIYTLDKVTKELEAIAKGRGKNAVFARVALEFAKRLNVLKVKKAVDGALLELAKKNFLIITQDKELQRKLKQINKNFGYLRQRKFLVV
jgi:rRNA-processing protein FCF1